MILFRYTFKFFFSIVVHVLLCFCFSRCCMQCCCYCIFCSFVKQLCSRLSISLVFIRFSWYNFQPMGFFCFVIHCTFFLLFFSFHNCSALVSRNIFARVSWCHFYSYFSLLLCPALSLTLALSRSIFHFILFFSLASTTKQSANFSCAPFVLVHAFFSLCPSVYVISFHCLTFNE